MTSRQKTWHSQSGVKIRVDQEEFFYDGASTTSAQHDLGLTCRVISDPTSGHKGLRREVSTTGSRGYSSTTNPTTPSATSSVASVDAISIISSADEDESSPVESPISEYRVVKTKSSMPSVVSSIAPKSVISGAAPMSTTKHRSSFPGLQVNATDGLLSPAALQRRSTASSGTKVNSSETHNQWSRPVPTSEFTIPHLPPPSPCQRLTSLPIWLVQHDLEYAAMKLMSPEVYRDFVTNGASRKKFRDFLLKEGTVGALDCEWDGKVVEELAGQIRSASQSIYDAYIDRRSATAVNIPDDIRQQLLQNLRQLAVVDAGLSIREGISSGTGCTELLLNYRLTGEPFWCLICIIPLRDAASNITYFIGGQVNVTSALASGSKLDFLIPGTAPTPEFSLVEISSKPEILPSGSQIIYSPTLQADSAARRTQGYAALMTQVLSEEAPNPRPSASPAGAALSVPKDHTGPTSDVPSASPKRRLSRFGWKAKEKRMAEQLLPGAEDVLAESGYLPLQDQFGIAEATYSRVLVLNVAKREIIFITPQLLAFLGLPFASVEDKFNSRLLHTDLLELITGDDKAHQKALRQTAKSIVKSGKPGSLVMHFKTFNKQNVMVSLKNGKPSRAGILHLTPLKERGNKVVAYVALFGESKSAA
ncbi:hypothetical protein HWV62_16294 [Athelia sp. TMB]|nr:hypothetical protein HWV62_16294 [Athelia sp. TMB]